MNFKELHQQESPLLICNVWDVVSAKAAQQLNYQAIATSSGAIAAMLGYQDGEEISFAELEYLVGRIRQSVDLPLSVDLEAGYSRDPEQIVAHILRLSKLGVVGINLEDSVVEGERRLLDCDVFCDLLENVCRVLDAQESQVFINIRTDTFLLNVPNAVEETIERGRKYQQAGAKGLFVPGIAKEEDIARVLQNIDLALNVMCLSTLPGFAVLAKLGVKRISMGNFVFSKGNKLLEKELSAILKSQSFHPLFDKKIRNPEGRILRSSD